MKRPINVRQHDITDCGAACLASVAAHFNLRLPVAYIRQLANTDRLGTNMVGMMEASEKLGFSSKGVRGSFNCLFDIPMPSIVHVAGEGRIHHFKVIYGIDKKKVILMDPADGKVHRMSHEEFKKEWTGIILILVPSGNFRSGRMHQSILRRFIDLIRPHRSVMLQSLFGAVIYALLGLATSIYVQKIVDFVLTDGNINLLNLMSLAMIVLLLLKTFINIFKSIFALRTGQHIDAVLIMGYYRHLLNLPQRFFDTMRVGEVISRISDAVKIRAFINNVSLELVVNFMIVVFTAAIMIFISLKMALIVILGIPLYLIVYFIYNLFNKRILRRIMENAAELEAHLVESLNLITTIKSFSAGGFANYRTEIRFFRLLRSIYDSTKSSILTQNASEILAGLLTIGLFWKGSVLVLNGEITPGTLLSFYALAGYLTGPVSYLINANQVIQDALIAADRLFQIMDLECEQSGHDNIIMTREMIGNIHFNQVSFRYGSRLQVLENLSLTFKAGEISAIVGESGSGKTSIVAILEKLYPIQSGSVEIGKYNLQQIDAISLRELIGIVPQRVDLMTGTIAENIAFGDNEPDLKRIIDICGVLNIRDFIEKIPGAYHAILGENGVSLSGGEQQRLAIARALYRDPQILILDEATSALDATSEGHMRHFIRYLRSQGKTVIIITHRFRTIKDADHIFVMHKGKMVEDGEHHILMTKKGYYFNLWKQQFPLLAEIKD